MVIFSLICCILVAFYALGGSGGVKHLIKSNIDNDRNLHRRGTYLIIFYVILNPTLITHMTQCSKVTQLSILYFIFIFESI